MPKFDCSQQCIERKDDEYHQMASHYCAKECWVCGEKTCFYSICFEEYICSDECADKAWRNYFDESSIGLS